MRSFLNIFGHSPFAPLQAHMEKVSMCVHKVGDLFDALQKNDKVLMYQIIEEISDLEHQADLAKHDIRNHLPRSLFLPVDRQALLEILSIQDSIADSAEDIGVLVSMKPMEIPLAIHDDFHLFLQKNIETFDKVREIINELKELLEASFGGIEAEKVRVMVHEVSFKEHEVDVIQSQLLKHLFKIEDEMSYGTFYLWQKIFESLASISNLSEKLAYRVRMILDLK